jgi:exonuclease VII small subunit
MQDKYKKAMLNNAQLDNEKMTLRQQLEAFKDQLDDYEESQQELQRDRHKVAQVLLIYSLE